jgi:hypothetical protein
MDGLLLSGQRPVDLAIPHPGLIRTDQKIMIGENESFCKILILCVVKSYSDFAKCSENSFKIYLASAEDNTILYKEAQGNKTRITEWKLKR